MSHLRTGYSMTALALSLIAAPSVAQQTIVVVAGTTDTTQKTVSGTDTVTVRAGGTRWVAARS